MRHQPALSRMGILVVAIAVQITASSGIAARLVRSPTSTSSPQIISTAPTNGPITCGAGIPIVTNLPAPHWSGKINFLIPSRKNTAPTIKRMAKIAEDTFPNPDVCPSDMPHLAFRFAAQRIAPRNGWSVTQSGMEKHLTHHWAMNYSVSLAVPEGRNNVAHRVCPERSEGEAVGDCSRMISKPRPG